jgi:hypothetical protein
MKFLIITIMMFFGNSYSNSWSNNFDEEIAEEDVIVPDPNAITWSNNFDEETTEEDEEISDGNAVTWSNNFDDGETSENEYWGNENSYGEVSNEKRFVINALGYGMSDYGIDWGILFGSPSDGGSLGGLGIIHSYEDDYIEMSGATLCGSILFPAQDPLYLVPSMGMGFYQAKFKGLSNQDDEQSSSGTPEINGSFFIYGGHLLYSSNENLLSFSIGMLGVGSNFAFVGGFGISIY